MQPNKTRVYPDLSGRRMFPSWLVWGQDDAMQVSDDILKCTVILGVQTKAGFLVEGTAFFVAFEQDDYVFSYLVTAAHLVWPGRRRADQAPPPGKLTIRITQKDGTAIPQTIDASEWLFAETGIDLCIHPTGMTRSEIASDVGPDTAFLNLSPGGMAMDKDNAVKSGMSLGDEVFVAGAYRHHPGTDRDISIVRIGNIAAMPREPIYPASPKVAPYLIETRSIGGISGSAVFLNMQNVRNSRAPKAWAVAVTNVEKGTTRQTLIVPYYLIGMVLGFHSGDYGTDMAMGSVAPTGDRSDVELNSGISVVLPVDAIINFLQSDKIREMRNKLIDAAERDSGYHPASAGAREAVKAASAEPQSDNPSHKEDFTSLLSAAARSSKPTS